MNEMSLLLDYTTQALRLVLLLSMIPIIIATVIGLLVSILQALTQIQEQTLPFAVKLIAISISLLATARWYGAEIYNFTYAILENFPWMTYY